MKKAYPLFLIQCDQGPSYLEVERTTAKKKYLASSMKYEKHKGTWNVPLPTFVFTGHSCKNVELKKIISSYWVDFGTSFRDTKVGNVNFWNNR